MSKQKQSSKHTLQKPIADTKKTEKATSLGYEEIMAVLSRYGWWIVAALTAAVGIFRMQRLGLWYRWCYR